VDSDWFKVCSSSSQAVTGGQAAKFKVPSLRFNGELLEKWTVASGQWLVGSQDSGFKIQD
jgi:hypothetical protein